MSTTGARFGYPPSKCHVGPNSNQLDKCAMEPFRRPGPKSRRALWWIGFLSFFMDGHHKLWHEGCALTTEGTGDDVTWASSNARGLGTFRLAGHPIPETEISRIQKRSMCRALRRATQFGHSWYRGQLITSDMKWVPPPPKEKLVTKRRPSKSSRLHAMLWNCNGLPYHHVLSWLAQQDLHVVILVETKCTWSNEWSSPHWHIIHSGCQYGGIMVLVSKKLASPDQLSLQAIVPGRLLHIRLHWLASVLDVIAVYQHAWNPENGREANLQRRRHIWNQLDKLLDTVSMNHHLMLCGDFNTDLHAMPPQIGPSMHATSWTLNSHKVHKDQHDFQDIVRRHNLTSLNTWGEKFCPTFAGHYGANSRIDHILTRTWNADPLARQSRPLTVCPLLDVQSGPKHFPVLASIAVQSRRPAHQNNSFASHATRRFRHHVQVAQYNQSPQWQHFVDNPPTFPANTDPLGSINKQLIHHTSTTFNITKPNRLQVWQTPSFERPVRMMWSSYRIYKSIRSTTHYVLFNAWKHITIFRKLKKQSRLAIKDHKRQQLQEALSIASNFAMRKDSYQWYNKINSIKKRNCCPKIHIRNVDGRLMGPLKEGQALANFFRELYHDPEFVEPCVANLDSMPFSEEEFCHALQQLPTRTATPAQFAPNIAWKTFAAQYAPSAYQYLSTLWCHQPQLTIPSEWKTSWLVLLPKPSKAPSRPEALPGQPKGVINTPPKSHIHLWPL